MSRYPYLLNRNGYYYFRIAVPLSLVDSFKRRELTYTLKTKNYNQAKIRSWAVLDIIQKSFQTNQPDPTLADIRIKIKNLNFQPDRMEDYSNLQSVLSSAHTSKAYPAPCT
jgi:hypothetical protein